MTVCMVTWQRVWSHDSVYGHMTVCMVTWQCVWSHGSGCGHMTVCMVTWQCIWSHDSVCVTWQCVWSHDSAYGHMTVCMVTWQCIWSHDSVCGHMTVRMVTWQCVWSYDSVCGHMTVFMLYGLYSGDSDCPSAPVPVCVCERPPLGDTCTCRWEFVLFYRPSLFMADTNMSDCTCQCGGKRPPLFKNSDGGWNKLSYPHAKRGWYVIRWDLTRHIKSAIGKLRNKIADPLHHARLGSLSVTRPLSSASVTTSHHPTPSQTNTPQLYKHPVYHSD